MVLLVGVRFSLLHVRVGQGELAPTKGKKGREWHWVGSPNRFHRRPGTDALRDVIRRRTLPRVEQHQRLLAHNHAVGWPPLLL